MCATTHANHLNTCNTHANHLKTCKSQQIRMAQFACAGGRTPPSLPHTYTPKHQHTYTPTHLHTYTHTHLQTDIQTDGHTDIQTYRHETCRHTDIHAVGVQLSKDTVCYIIRTYGIVASCLPTLAQDPACPNILLLHIQTKQTITKRVIIK